MKLFLLCLTFIAAVQCDDLSDEDWHAKVELPTAEYAKAAFLVTAGSEETKIAIQNTPIYAK